MKYKKIHFVGIKGVGMTPLAVIAKEAGCVVTGSDINEEFITDDVLKNAGITPYPTFSPDYIEDIDLVITTGAHGGYDNIEVVAAKQKNIPVLSQGEAVGVFMDGGIFDRKFEGISITGTHGKTTTTAMIATLLKNAGLDPSFIIGTSSIPSLGSPGHFGKGKYFVAEADEYGTEPTYDKTPKFLWQHPTIALFTNIELDHPDIYQSVADVRNSFLKFANQLPEKGVLVCNGDDSEVKLLVKEYGKRAIRFGFSPINDYVITRISISGNQTFFWVDAFGTSLGEFVLKVTGEHNALNALGAAIVGLEIGIPIEKVKKGLQEFTGSKRRMEYKGHLVSGVYVYDDYAHHPTEIRQTLKAFRKIYPKKKIVCVFQPHTYSRTKKLFEEFLRAFSDADTIIISDIYASLREEKDETISSNLLAERMKSLHSEVYYVPEPTDVVKYINQKHYGEDTILITMGAGNIYKILEGLEFKANK